MADHEGGIPLDKNVKDTCNDSLRQKVIVYIWDMDETLILLKSLLDGTFGEAYRGKKDVQQGIDIGKMWENYILDVCDHYFFYEQIEHYNQPVVNSLSQFDDGVDLSDYDFGEESFGPPTDDLNKQKLAYRHRVIDHKYKQGLQSILDQKKIEQLNTLYEITDSYTDGWLSSARALLQQCSSQCESSSAIPASDNTEIQRYSILVTSGALIPSLVKCLLFKLDGLITSENVYSSWDVGKLQCFSWIQKRFDIPNVQFCVIGDGCEEAEAAEILRWPFVKIDPIPHGFHKFPGLTQETLGHYLSVVYGPPDSETENQVSSSSAS